MDGSRSLPRKPLVLVAGQHPWLLRSIESILSSAGFAIVGWELGEPLPRDLAPDLIIVEADEPERSWAELLALVRGTRGFGTTPIIATTAEPLTRQRRLEALRAGAWDVMGYPLDAEVMVLKAAAFARSKFEADEARERGLIDPETELYNLRGVMRRIYEEASEAERHSRPLACLVAGLAMASDQGNGEAAARTRSAVQALRTTGRASDVLGRLGPNEFVVIAPATDSKGAFRLAQRLTTETDDRLPGLQAGYAAVPDVRQAKLEPVDLFVRAVVALRAAQALGPEERIRSFD